MPGESDMLPNLLNFAIVKLIRFVRRADRSAPVGPAQLSALSVLYFSGAISTSQLAELEMVAQPTMSRIIGSLVDSASVVRLPHPDDARSQLLEITPLGRQIFEDARDERSRVLQKIVDHLQPGTAARLTPDLEDLLNAMHQVAALERPEGRAS